MFMSTNKKLLWLMLIYVIALSQIMVLSLFVKLLWGLFSPVGCPIISVSDHDLDNIKDTFYSSIPSCSFLKSTLSILYHNPHKPKSFYKDFVQSSSSLKYNYCQRTLKSNMVVSNIGARLYFSCKK